MTCRENRGSSAWTSFVRLSMGGLTDQQMLSSFHELQREGVDAPAPNSEAVVRSLDAMIRRVSDESGRGYQPRPMAVARRNSILTRLREAQAAALNGEGLPTGPQFYAWRSLVDRSAHNVAGIETVTAGYAQRMGITPVQARQEFDRLVTESEGAGRTGDRLQPEVHPTGLRLRDPHTLHAVAVMARNSEAFEAGRGGATARRVPDSMFRPVNSTLISQVGHNPENGDLEVEFTGGNRYRLSGVPDGLASEMVASRNPAAVFARMVRNPDFITDQADPEPVSEPNRCESCGQFVGETGSCQNPDCGSVPQPVRRSPRRTGTTEERAAARAADRAAAQQQRSLERHQSLLERRVAYDAIPVRNGPWTSLTELRVRVPTHLAAEGIADAELSEQISVAGQFRIPPYANLALGPLMMHRNFVAYVPNGRVSVTAGRPTASQVTFASPVVGRLDPDRVAGARLVSGQVHCHVCDVTVTVPPGSGCEHIAMAIDGMNIALGGGTVSNREEQLRATVASYQGYLRSARADYLAANPTIIEGRMAAWAADQEQRETRRAREAALTAGRVGEPIPLNDYLDLLPSNGPRWSDSPEGKAEFTEAYTESKGRMASGEPALTLDLEPWENASTRGFGSEIEFFIPPANRQAALRTIGQALYDGLPEDVRPVSPNQLYYGAGRSDTTRWRFEEDCTVDAEIVSPIMYDNPETWRQFQIVCDIVKRHGGCVRDPDTSQHTPRTAGSHVHVGVGDFDHDVTNHSNLAAITGRFEDTRFRLATTPGGNHRGTRWCDPTSQPAGFETMRQVGQHTSHSLATNYQSASEGGPHDHVELREGDGTLNPATLQARARVYMATVDSARQASAGGHALTGPKTVIGTQNSRTGTRRLTGTEWEEAHQPLREFADLLAGHHTDRRLQRSMVGLFAQGKWVRD